MSFFMWLFVALVWSLAVAWLGQVIGRSFTESAVAAFSTFLIYSAAALGLSLVLSAFGLSISFWPLLGLVLVLKLIF